MAEIVKTQDTRREFIDTLCELAAKDTRVVFIVPDVGFLYVDKFSETFPDRYFNLGTTEASTIMIATGMALSGLSPYVYSMRNFVLFRPYEMVRNGIVCHNANVKLLGVKGSEKYRFLGWSHNLLHEKEDINVCENIGLEHHSPQTPEEVHDVVLRTYETEKPCYIAL